jgi:hypothetical protein
MSDVNPDPGREGNGDAQAADRRRGPAESRAQVAAQFVVGLEHQRRQAQLPGHVDDGQQGIREQVGFQPRRGRTGW